MQTDTAHTVHAAPAPVIGYVAPTSVVEYMIPAPAPAAHAAPAPVTEYVTPVPSDFLELPVPVAPFVQVPQVQDPQLQIFK